jgi:hypothetical protein
MLSTGACVSYYGLECHFAASVIVVVVVVVILLTIKK